MSLRLGPRIVAAIKRHGADTYPYECCGALIGSTQENGDVEVVDVRPLDNVTSEGPRRRFLVSAQDYAGSQSHARRAGLELLGFYHSHPDHPAEPSQYDLDHAWPNFSYVIVAVGAGRPGDVRSWRLRADRSSFEEEMVHTHVDQNSDPHAASRLHR
jgi:proteasome lid subunit RPN8/RPN11